MTALHAIDPSTRRVHGDSIHGQSGASVEISREDGAERLRVRDQRGALIFEYDPETGRATLTTPGDLALKTGGRLDLAADKGVSLSSSGPVALHSGTCVSAGVAASGRFAGLRALPGKLALSGRRMEVSADEADFNLLQSSLRGERTEATVERMRLTASRVETVADRAIRRFRNLYEQVEDLKQERLGRLRTLVRGAIEWRSDRATLVAEREVRLDGERIHLG